MSTEQSESDRPSVNRREFVRTAVIVGAVASATVTAIAAADNDVPVSGEQRQALVDLARLVATKPVPFPSFGESGEAWQRANGERLIPVLQKATPERTRRAGRGATRILEANFGGTDESRVRLLGEFMASNDSDARADLRAAVAVAIATISAHYRVDHDNAANLWLDFVRHYYLRTRATQ